jgi:hypothetical protein
MRSRKTVKVVKATAPDTDTRIGKAKIVEDTFKSVTGAKRAGKEFAEYLYCVATAEFTDAVIAGLVKYGMCKPM